MTGNQSTEIGDHATEIPVHVAETHWLDRPVDADRDHLLGPPDAPITLVEYGSYACPHCRAANERITEVRGQLGDRLRYVFRHRPLIGNDLARRAAELAESASTDDQFWDAHVMLMTRSGALNENDLDAVADMLGLTALDAESASSTATRARRRVGADVDSARASGVQFTPTFFINGRRYDGPWDESSFTDAMLGALGHFVRTAALSFARWAPSTGILLLLAVVAAIALTNSPVGPSFSSLWQTDLGVVLGKAAFRMPLRDWVNDALLTVFFFVVGLEIKREFTVGHLSNRRAAALPVAAAIGGMAVPALIYIFIVSAGPWSVGWGVPMATDTAFSVAVIAMLGARVPVELRIFLTAAAIVDDIGAIVVVAAFYSGTLHLGYLLAALAVTALLALMNKSAIYWASPYILIGIVLWVLVYASGLDPTLAGVVLAAFIPTRQPPDFRTLAMQADTILAAEARYGGKQLHRGPSAPAMEALDAIHDRLESPADRLLRTVAPRSSYVVLPVFALANAGVVVSFHIFNGHGMLAAAIVTALVVGKPLGFVLGAGLAVWLGVARKPDAYSWRHLVGASVLAGIGFTMSLFIAAQAFPDPTDFSASKLAVFAASLLSTVIGVMVLWGARAEKSFDGDN